MSKSLSFSKVKKKATGPNRPPGNVSGREHSYLPQVQQKVSNLKKRERKQQKAVSTERSEDEQPLLRSQTETRSEQSSTEEQPISLQTDTTTPMKGEASITLSETLAAHDKTQVIDQHKVDDQSQTTPPTASTESAFDDTDGDNDIELAERLTNPDEIRKYFSHLIEEPAVAALDDQLQKSSQLDSITLKQVTEKNEQQFSQVCNLPLKVILTPLSRGRTSTSRFTSLLESEYGPIRATLQVGNVLLEWDDLSLVIPKSVEENDNRAQASDQHIGEWVDFASEQSEKMRSAAEKRDFHKQIELVYLVTEVKTRLISNLVDVIVQYNRILYYDLIGRNCQHFVTDALKALGVEKPIAFKGGLGAYYKALKNDRSKSIPDKFSSHSELTKSVKRIQQSKGIDSLLQQDLEFLLAQYFRFHLQSKAELKEDFVAMENWKCTESECCMQELERRIEFDLLRIHSFRAT